MEYVLRDYQQAGVEKMCDFLLSQRKVKRNGLVYAPTGSGKALLAAATAVELARHPKGGPVILFQPTKEILEQNLEKVRSYGFQAGVFSASMNRREVADVTLCTVGTVFQRSEWFTDFPFGLIDEAHLVSAKDNSHIVSAGEGNEFYHRDHGLVREVNNQEGIAKGRVLVVDEEGVEHAIPRPKKGMYKSFIEQLPHMAWVGLTGSPYRLESNAMGSQLKVLPRTRPRIWHDFIFWVQYKELFDRGFLAKMDYFQVKGFKRSNVALNSAGADYSKDALQMHLWEKNWESKSGKQVHFPDKLTEVVNRVLNAGRRNALIFTTSVREAEHVAEQMKGACAVVTGETPPGERDATISDFRAGKIPALANVKVLSIGFDFPELECVIDASPTMSLARYDQRLGRLTRPHERKESAWAIDMAGGYEQFGRLEDRTLYCQGQTRWDIFGRPGGGAEKQLTSVWLSGAPGCCPKCGARKQMAFYLKSQKWVPLSSPPAGYQANIVVKQEGSKKTCEMVERGDPAAQFCFHFLVCDKFRRLREG